MMKTVALIPCRVNSSRLEGKLLKEIEGFPLFYHVFIRTKLSSLDEIYICSGDKEIINKCIELDIPYIKTKKNHQNGTERCAEAANKLRLNNNDLVINVQGDEVLYNPTFIKTMIDFYKQNKSADIVTLYGEKFTSNNINETKLVTNSLNKVLYISRYDIPYDVSKNKNQTKKVHIGMFLFKKNILDAVIEQKSTFNERCESIELIRSLELDLNVFALKVDTKNLVSVDSKEDFEIAKKLISKDKIFQKAIKKV